MKTPFIAFEKTEDNSTIYINFTLVGAIAKIGDHIKVMIGNEWIELNVTLSQFVEKCNEN